MNPSSLINQIVRPFRHPAIYPIFKSLILAKLVKDCRAIPNLSFDSYTLPQFRTATVRGS